MLGLSLLQILSPRPFPAQKCNTRAERHLSPTSLPTQPPVRFLLQGNDHFGRELLTQKPYKISRLGIGP